MEVLMEKLLTVVVPSYNVEKYLEETLESFVIPEIMDDLEVLIVNDGSKDRTPEIGAAYEKRYPQTFRLISKENGGHGSTINRGIEEAKGTYFKVVDGDDWVDRGGFTELLHRLKTSGADYVVTDYYKVNDGTKEKKLETFPYLKAHPKCRFEDVVGNTDILMHALVIRTAILKENGIRLDEHCFYVDNEYITFPVPFVETVEYYEIPVYMYRLAQATQSVSMQGFQKHLPDHVKVTIRLVQFAAKYSEMSEENKETSPAQKKKAEYLNNRAAVMVGDQAGIFASFPGSNEEIRRQFLAFDAEVKKTSEEIYRLSGEKSHMLAALRKRNFKGYRFWTWVSRVRAKVRKV